MLENAQKMRGEGRSRRSRSACGSTTTVGRGLLASLLVSVSLLWVGTAPAFGADKPPPCHVTVTLVEVTYAGDDVGEDWTFSLGVGKNVLTLHRTFPKSAVAIMPGFVAVKDEGMASTGTFHLSVKATEADRVGWFGDDDIGHASIDFSFARCPFDETRSIEVAVKALGTLDPNGTAKLTFKFQVSGR